MFDAILEGDFQIPKGKMEGVGVIAEFRAKGNRRQDTGGLYVSEVGRGASKGSDVMWVDCIEVSDGGNEGKEVPIQKLLLGVPNFLIDLVDDGILMRVRSCANARWIVEKVREEGGVDGLGSWVYGGGGESDRWGFFLNEDRRGVLRWWGR